MSLCSHILWKPHAPQNQGILVFWIGDFPVRYVQIEILVKSRLPVHISPHSHSVEKDVLHLVRSTNLNSEWSFPSRLTTSPVSLFDLHQTKERISQWTDTRANTSNRTVLQFICFVSAQISAVLLLMLIMGSSVALAVHARWPFVTARLMQSPGFPSDQTQVGDATRPLSSRQYSLSLSAMCLGDASPSSVSGDRCFVSIRFSETLGIWYRNFSGPKKLTRKAWFSSNYWSTSVFGVRAPCIFGESPHFHGFWSLSLEFRLQMFHRQSRWHRRWRGAFVGVLLYL